MKLVSRLCVALAFAVVVSTAAAQPAVHFKPDEFSKTNDAYVEVVTPVTPCFEKSKVSLYLSVQKANADREYALGLIVLGDGGAREVLTARQKGGDELNKLDATSEVVDCIGRCRVQISGLFELPDELDALSTKGDLDIKFSFDDPHCDFIASIQPIDFDDLRKWASAMASPTM